MELKLTPGKVTLPQLRRIAREAPTLVLATDCRARVDAGAAIVQSVLDRGDTVYGLNTGFGAMARTRIDAESLRPARIGEEIARHFFHEQDKFHQQDK